jgi:hypothetical protein
MLFSKSRLLASGLAAAGLAGAVALGFAAPHLGRGLLPSGPEQTTLDGTAPAAPVLVAGKAKDTAEVEPPAAQADAGRTVRVEAPSTSVNIDKERGNVRVKAPHTDVRVDPDKGQVRVRAPYVNLDIRW